jgi:hypothetical protein
VNALTRTARRLRHVASGAGRTGAPRWNLHGDMVRHARFIVTFYYVACAYFLYDGARDLSHLEASPDSLDLLWPVAWLSLTGVRTGGEIIAQLGLAAGLLGLVWWRVLAVRILVSTALLLYTAYANSHGAINHGYHEWFWISVCFWLLPSESAASVDATRTRRMQFLTAFGLAPLLILFFYTLSGLYKTYYAFAAILSGEPGGFSPDAMAITVAWRAIQTGAEPMWGAWVIGQPLLGWPMYMLLYFVELVSVLIFFRPCLHRAWGVLLIAFHVGTLLFMDISFERHILINGMLFVMSPFASGAHGWRTQLLAVPLLGLLGKRFLKPKLAASPEPQQGVAAET